MNVYIYDNYPLVLKPGSTTGWFPVSLNSRVFQINVAPRIPHCSQVLAIQLVPTTFTSQRLQTLVKKTYRVDAGGDEYF
jgi:hypothetical protein